MGGAARRQETRRRRGRNGGVGAARVHGDGPGGAGAEWSQTDEGGVAVHLVLFFTDLKGICTRVRRGVVEGPDSPPLSTYMGRFISRGRGVGVGKGRGEGEKDSPSPSSPSPSPPWVRLGAPGNAWERMDVLGSVWMRL